MKSILLIVAFMSTSRLDSQVEGQRVSPVDSAWSRPEPRDGIARELPEFGGIYGDTAIEVQLTDLARASLAEALVRRELAGRPGIDRERIGFVLVAFSHRQLRSWRECLLPDLVGGVSMHGLWTLQNRIIIGVIADSTHRRVEAAIRKRGLPREAFIIEITRTRFYDRLNAPAS